MIPQGHEEDLVHSGINFMRAVTEAYGAEEGMKLWDAISTTLDPDIKGQILFAMLTGRSIQRITVYGVDAHSINRKVEQIKALRVATGWGLKEAKDAVDLLSNTGKPVTFDCQGDLRSVRVRELQAAGLRCS